MGRILNRLLTGQKVCTAIDYVYNPILDKAGNVYGVTQLGGIGPAKNICSLRQAG